MKFIALGYHDVVDGRGSGKERLRSCPSQYTLERSTFRDHLQSILERTSATSVLTVEKVEKEPNRSERQVFLTFDDGAVGAYKCVAPELERFQLLGHFFIVSNWVGKPGFMTASQIRELRRRGHLIGSHSCSHPERMSALPEGELRREWTESVSVLEDILGERVTVASLPNGYYSKRVSEAARLARITTLFTSEPKMSLERVDDLMVLGRYAIFSDTPAHVAGSLAAGSRHLRWRQAATWEVKKAAKAIGGESYLKLRRQVLSMIRSK